MSNFIVDGLTLPVAKTDLNPLGTADPTKYMAAADFNALRQALIDTQTFLRGGFELFDSGGANGVLVINVAGAPVSAAPKGSLAVDRTNARLYLNTDGGTTWAQVGSSAGSIAIASEVAGNFDFATLGTLDWTYAEAWGVGKHLYHGKRDGGWLLDSFNFVMTEGASSVDTRGWLNHASSADDVDVNGLHNVGDTLGVTRNLNGYNGVGALNSGFRFRLPCNPTPRTVRWQGTAFNALTLVTAKIDAPGVAATQTQHFDTTAGNGLDYRAAVTFSGPIGSWLVVSHVVATLIGGGSGNLYVGAIGCA